MHSHLSIALSPMKLSTADQHTEPDKDSKGAGTTAINEEGLKRNERLRSPPLPPPTPHLSAPAAEEMKLSEKFSAVSSSGRATAFAWDPTAQQH
jgi:hypothetical protein